MFQLLQLFLQLRIQLGHGDDRIATLWRRRGVLDRGGARHVNYRFGIRPLQRAAQGMLANGK